jgi:hypothetical protein
MKSAKDTNVCHRLVGTFDGLIVARMHSQFLVSLLPGFFFSFHRALGLLRTGINSSAGLASLAAGLHEE